MAHISPQGSVHCATNPSLLVSTLFLKSKRQPLKRHSDASEGIQHFFQSVNKVSSTIPINKAQNISSTNDDTNKEKHVGEDDTKCPLIHHQHKNLNSTEVNQTLVMTTTETSSLQCDKNTKPLQTRTVISADSL